MRSTVPTTRTALFTLLTAGALSLGGVGVAAAAEDEWPTEPDSTGESSSMESQPGGQGGFDEGAQPGSPGGYDEGTQPGSQGGFDESTQPGSPGGYDEGTQPGSQGGFDESTQPGTSEGGSVDDQQSDW